MNVKTAASVLLLAAMLFLTSAGCKSTNRAKSPPTLGPSDACGPDCKH